jgi:hypothetical protein
MRKTLELMPKSKLFDSRLVNLMLLTLLTEQELQTYFATGKVGKTNESKPPLSPKRRNLISSQN